MDKNIVLSGGSTMFQHLGQRLKRDLKQLVDRRLDPIHKVGCIVFEHALFDLFCLPVLRSGNRSTLT